MPLNAQKKQLFVDVAESQGFDRSEIDSFLSQAESQTGGIEPQSFVQEIPRGPVPSPAPVAKPVPERDTFVKEALDIRAKEVQPAVAGVTTDLGSIADQERVIPNKVRINKQFGARNPQDVFSQGINNGTDFNTPRGTPVAVPEGEWIVQESFGGSTREGFIGNNDNNGFGNSVLVQNTETGETLRFSHLDKVGVEPGDRVSGGNVVALSGNTGNSSGQHLDVEFRDQRGVLADVLSSRYRGAF